MMKLHLKSGDFVLEESFAALIGIIFIYEAFDKMLDIKRQRPVRLHTIEPLPGNCSCRSQNWTSYQRPNTTISVRNKNRNQILRRKISFILIGMH